jgi:voltage-gated potassium channel
MHCSHARNGYPLETAKGQFGSVPSSLWWAVVTLSSVGYGDVYPVTTGGRIFAALVILLGIGLVAVPTGILASALSKSIKGR